MDDKEVASTLTLGFSQSFGTPPEILVNSPGRINLIGEHTDYCGGLVLPFASNLSIGFAALPRPEPRVAVEYLDLGEGDSFALPPRIEERGMASSRYLKGVIQALQSNGYRVGGMDLAIMGDLPIEAGMSSSAALELGTCMCAEFCSNLRLDPLTRAKICHQAEREYFGVQCGIMDQYACALGERERVLLIDCATGYIERIPLKLDGSALLVCDSRVRRELSNSAYNLRRRECEEAISLIMSRGKYSSLVEMREDSEWEMEAENLPLRLQPRLKHFIEENQRVRWATECLKNGDLERLGKIIYQSHCSLRDLYHVSIAQLDFLVDRAMATEGVLGSRLMGAGFGGCTLNLVLKEHVDSFKKRIAAEYRERYGLEAVLYEVYPSEGSHFVSI